MTKPIPKQKRRRPTAGRSTHARSVQSQSDRNTPTESRRIRAGKRPTFAISLSLCSPEHPGGVKPSAGGAEAHIAPTTQTVTFRRVETMAADAANRVQHAREREIYSWPAPDPPSGSLFTREAPSARRAVCPHPAAAAVECSRYSLDLKAKCARS